MTIVDAFCCGNRGMPFVYSSPLARFCGVELTTLCWHPQAANLVVIKTPLLLTWGSHTLHVGAVSWLLGVMNVSLTWGATGREAETLPGRYNHKDKCGPYTGLAKSCIVQCLCLQTCTTPITYPFLYWDWCKGWVKEESKLLLVFIRSVYFKGRAGVLC